MMSSDRSRPASPEQVARYGHIAGALRRHLEAKGMAPGDLAEALGHTRDNTSCYHWINCKGAPGKANRRKLAKLLGVPEIDLLERPFNGESAATPAARLPVPMKAAPAVRTAEALSFAVAQDGSARIRLDVVLPLATASSLLRMILDAGVMFSPGAE